MATQNNGANSWADRPAYAMPDAPGQVSKPTPQTLDELLCPGAHVHLWFSSPLAVEVVDRRCSGVILDADARGILFQRDLGDAGAYPGITCFIAWNCISILAAYADL